MSAIALRLRVPLRLKTRDQRLYEAAFGIELPPTVLPARTTLRVVDFFTGGLYALTPEGRHVLVGYETAREHGYPPRARPGA